MALELSHGEYLSGLARKISKQLQAREKLLSAGARLDPAFAAGFATETKRFKDQFAEARGDGQRLRALRRALRHIGIPHLKNCMRRAGTVSVPMDQRKAGADSHELQASA
jgi:hypothetical protein